VPAAAHDRLAARHGGPARRAALAGGDCGADGALRVVLVGRGGAEEGEPGARVLQRPPEALHHAAQSLAHLGERVSELLRVRGVAGGSGLQADGGDELALFGRRSALRARRRCRRPELPHQQLAVELLHGRAGGCPQLVAQQHAQALVGAQRLRGVAARGERPHQDDMRGLRERRRRRELARGAFRPG
jgi:hypothetical protein